MYNFRSPNQEKMNCSIFKIRWRTPFFHLERKNSGKFANRKYEERFTQIRKYATPYSRNATPSRGTSPLASYKEVRSPLTGGYI